jgi:shikimate kinase
VPGRAAAASVGGMSRVLVTGMSGAGKSTVLNELSGRGHRTVDTDYDGWVLPDSTWDEPRMEQLLAECRDVVVSGTVENQVCFYDRFEHVVLLSAPVEVLMQRVGCRRNPYGRTQADRDEIAEYLRTVEPLLRRGATVELDGRRQVGHLADAIERLCRQPVLPHSPECSHPASWRR